ncbi:MAG: DUF371 domain-containing protein [Candidatus Heimdallarchaeaceae archaeon]
MMIRFYCYGHPNILSTHKTTLEFTVDEDLSLRGNCILGVRASLSLKSFSEEMKKLIRKSSTKIKVIIQVDDLVEEIIGYGDPNLELSDERAIIIRTSDYICPRTLMIRANKASKDISRHIVELMKVPEKRMTVTIQVWEEVTDTSRHA